ncbi:MAG: hypothetical protein J0L99_01525 [Chitinophagales bacterium]|nr:hypothetical protein [Chitinophagales bacterium]
MYRLLICLALLLPQILVAQNCLSGGINFTSQAQIDAFPTNYPTCTHIIGTVEITGNTIQNLDGLAQVSSMGNQLYIGNNPLLDDISGLSNLNSVNFMLTVSENPTLSSLNGLQNLNSVYGINIYFNNTLNGLDELSGITSLAGGLNISDNAALTDLDGLQNLSTVSGSVSITGNAALSSFATLSNLTSVGGSFGISYSAASNLNGLQNLQNVGGLAIAYNANLNSIGQLSSLNSINGNLFIQSNTALPNLNGFTLPTGFNREIWINDNTALTSLVGLESAQQLVNLSITGNAISNLNGLNNLQTVSTSLGIGNNPNLNDLTALSMLQSAGNIAIVDNDALVSLNGLDALTNITNDGLYFQYNNSLTDLTALDGLLALPGGLYLEDNDALQNLQGLHHIQSIGYLTIQGNAILPNLNGLNQLGSTAGGIFIIDNPILSDLTALSNLTQVGSEINVIGQAALNSLSGLDNINPANLIYVNISNNGPALTYCAVQSICDYLALNGPAMIEMNGADCNSEAQIEAACLTLPLELLHFSGSIGNGSVQLQWAIGDAGHCSHFELEKRGEQGDFESISSIPFQPSRTAYHFSEPQKIQAPQYYRLRMVDLDGKSVLSPIVRLAPQEAAELFYPNPTQGPLLLKNAAAESCNLRLYNAQGILVLEQDQTPWNIAHLPPGQYLAWLQTPQGVSTQLIFRQ